VPAILQVMAALLRSHGSHLAGHAKAIAVLGALCAAFAGMAGIFGSVFGVYVLALWLGWTAALAILFGIGVFGLLVAALLLWRQTRLLARAHGEHVEQERLALQAAIAEVAAVYRVSASLAGLSASIAAILLLILRRIAGSRESPEDEPRSPMEPPPEAHDG
jgi:MFS family permease